MKLRVLLTVGVMAWSMPALGQGKDGPGDRMTRGKRVLKRGGLAALKGHRVTIAGRKTMTVGEIADAVFADQRAQASEMQRARKGLRGALVVSDEVIETDDAVVLSSTTAYTVTDPDEVRRQSPRFRNERKRMAARGSWSVAKLDSAKRAEFNAWRDEVKKYPADHPLRVAADQGDDALVDALIEGKGDFEVTETLVIPKVDIKRDASDNVLAPLVSADGTMDFGVTKAVKTHFRSRGRQPSGSDVDVPVPARTTRKGTSRHTAQFLAGFTEEDAFVWHKHFKFPSGHLDVKFNAWYAFGLRIPLEVEGKLSPDTIDTVGASDGVEPFSVVLSARTLDANESFYREVGLANDELHGGKEFVLEAGFDVVIDVKAGWVIQGHWRIPKNGLQIDWGQHFKPPFGDCGNNCGPELWIPASVTNTSIGILGIVRGSARAGFKFAGNGEVDVDYEALYGTDEIKSWNPGGKQDARKRHRVSFTKHGQSRTMNAELAPLGHSGASRPYGYRLSEPGYTWKVEAIPGVRADIDLKAWPIITDSFPIGPKWFDSLAIPLGTLKLGHHRGTKKTYNVKQGEKTYSKQ